MEKRHFVWKLAGRELLLGKRTLLRVLVGELPPDDGEYAVGGLFGYMAQDVGVGDGERTVRELLL